MRPQQLGPSWKDGKISGKEVWKPLKNSLDNFYAQPWRWEGDEHVVVTETYKTSGLGFPGDLHSATGSQGLYRPIRSHLLSETADLDMKVAMPTILLWVCKQFGIEAPNLEYYVKNRESVLGKFVGEAECSRAYAKGPFNIAWTWDQKSRGACNNSSFYTAYDAEAKRVQKELMKRKELQWILPYLDPEGARNRAGSFVAKLFHFVQAPLLRRIMFLLREEEGEQVACIVFDGLNVANAAHHGDESLLQKCTAACEEVCPGINMGWAWKLLDYEVRTKDTKVRVPDRHEGRVLIKEGKLCIPDDYQTHKRPDYVEEGDEAVAGGGGGGVALDPRVEPTYEQMYTEFSLPDGKHGKVGCDFIEVLNEESVDGRGKKLAVYGRDKFIHTHEDMVYYTIENAKDDDGNAIEVKKQHAFIIKWIKDPMKDTRYLRDPSRKCKWAYFDMHPDAAKCPDNCYNLFRGFAAETMAPEVNIANLEPDVQQKLDRILGHVRMLCERDGPRHERFLLDFLAHLVQHPNLKFGVMCCLLGIQGIGKQHLWDVIERMVGRHACFETNDPARDVWGDNNDNMRTAFMVRIIESDRKTYAGQIGKVRNMITDPRIRVRSLYGAATNVRSYFRGFGDSNDRNAIPDSDNERRFFVLNCNPAKVGDTAYFSKLGAAIEDDRVIRAFYLFLKARTGIKERYNKNDIPVGAFARELKASKRSVQEKFLVWLIEQQPTCSTEARFTGDTLYDRFEVWQKRGNEFERSKASFLDWLRLNSFDIPGIAKHRPEIDIEGQPSHIDGKPVKKKKIQVTEYILNLILLRKHYRLEPDTTESRLNLGEDFAGVDAVAATVDSYAAGNSSDHHGDGAQPMDAAEDEDDLAPEERGRRMHARGEGPLSPNPQNDAVRRGYEKAADAAAFAAASSAAPSTGAPSMGVAVVGDMPLTGDEATQEGIDSRRAERQARHPQPGANGKERARPVPNNSMPPAKRPRPTVGSGGGDAASVALVRTDGHVLLTRETRNGKKLLNLPGGKAQDGESHGQTAAREAHEETGGQLTDRTRAAVAAIADWARCGAEQGVVGVLHLAANSPDATVDERFDCAAANANRRSKTVHDGLEWHPVANASSHDWRAKHMHFPGQHRLAAATRALGTAGSDSGAGSSGSGSAAPSALNVGDAVADA